MVKMKEFRGQEACPSCLVPVFGRFNGQNERISRSGGTTLLSMPAYAYHGDSIVLYISEKQLYTFSLGIDCKILVKEIGNR